MADPFVSEVRIFSGNFAPTGWAFCDGSAMSVSQNTALFSLINNTFGGDGIKYFNLPNLQGRVPIHAGQGPGLSQRQLGESGGEEVVTLGDAEMPAHAHQLATTNNIADSNIPDQKLLAVSTGTFVYNSSTGGQPVKMNPQTIAIAGGSMPHNNLQPYLALTFILAITGIYPPKPN